MWCGSNLAAGPALLLLLVAGSGCAPTPVCQREEVLQEVGRIVRTENVYNAVDPNLVAEAPGPRPNLVACTVSVTGATYLPSASGYEVRRSRVSRRYDVAVTGNRFVVTVLP